MGAGISQEQVANHLSRQEALIRQLQAVVDLQGTMLENEQAKVPVAVPTSAADKVASASSSVPDDELSGLERRARAAEHRKHGTIPVDEDERRRGNITWTEPSAEEERGFMATKPWLGAMAPPTNFQFGLTDAPPAVSLQLHHVYGYRASGVRNNVINVDRNTLLYFAAGVGIVHDLTTNTQKFFLGHQDDIVSIDYHPGLKIVVTGEQGKIPAIHVWDVKTCAPLAKIAGLHKRAVCSVSFSADGSRVASVGLDDDYTLAVHEWSSGTCLSRTKGGSDRIIDVQFVQGVRNTDGNSSLVTVGSNHVVFWKLANGTLTKNKADILSNGGKLQVFLCSAFTSMYTIVGTQGGEMYVFKDTALFKIVDAHNENLFCLKGLGADTVVSGAQDGMVAVWNMANFTKSKLVNMNKVESPEVLKAGTVSVRSVDAFDADEITASTITGSIYKIKISKNQITCVHTSHYGDLTAPQGYGELWGLSVVSRNLIATAGEDRTLRLWDFTTRKETTRIQLAERAQCVATNPAGTHIVVGLQTGHVALYTMTGQLISSTTKGKRRVQNVRFSPSGNLVAVATADNWVDIYGFADEQLSYKGRLKGHSSVVLKIDFSADEKYLQTCSQAYELLFFDLTNMTQVTASRSLKDVKWATFTSILGWDVQGIWPPESDGSDVNSVARSKSGRFLATAEDSGLVKVYQYPCVGGGLDKTGRLVRRPESVSGSGHSEHVTEIKWSQDDGFIFSTGGGDLSIFQWKVVPAGTAAAAPPPAARAAAPAAPASASRK